MANVDRRVAGGGRILPCTIGGCLSDLIKANAAEYQRGASDGFREGCRGNPEVS